MIKRCLNCNKEYEAKTKKSRFCCNSCYSQNYVKIHSNSTCIYCGKPFWSSDINNRCCSTECKNRYYHKIGKRSYAPCIEEERNIPSLKDWIDYEHNVKMRTILDISNDIEVPRITINRWCDEWGVKHRTVSEDNHRRYATMSQDDKNKQTKAANIEIRELFKDDEWKNNQIRKVLKAQNFNASKPELAMRQALIEHGYIDFIPQYQLGPFFVDIAFPDIKLAVEIDGEYWHSLDAVKKRDKRKNYYIINKEGWQLLRIPAIPCDREPHKAVWTIIEYIETLKQETQYGDAIN